MEDRKWYWVYSQNAPFVMHLLLTEEEAARFERSPLYTIREDE